MIRYLSGLLLIAVVAVGCLKGKDDAGCPYRNVDVKAPAAEQDSVKAYLDSNGIQDAVHHSSGFYYKILNAGAGSDSMTLCSQLQVTYTGKLTNDTIFDQQDHLELALPLGGMIEGWKKGLPLIKRGGRIQLFIPPSLGYGNNDIRDNQTGEVVIPAKSMLVFDVTLDDYR
jgi:FKBP-type peptidyl-prolyl cis-trans isomerase FkpA